MKRVVQSGMGVRDVCVKRKAGATQVLGKGYTLQRPRLLTSVGVEGESVQAGAGWRELAPKSAEGYSPNQGRVRNETAFNVKACCGAMA